MAKMKICLRNDLRKTGGIRIHRDGPVGGCGDVDGEGRDVYRVFVRREHNEDDRDFGSHWDSGGQVNRKKKLVLKGDVRGERPQP